MSPPGMRPKNHPQSQRNVLRASHLQLKTKGETEQMTQHWG
jgi:dTDP-4-dehydrorhamnose 3,5-epimerase-like enzyme